MRKRLLSKQSSNHRQSNTQRHQTQRQPTDTHPHRRGSRTRPTGTGAGTRLCGITNCLVHILYAVHLRCSLKHATGTDVVKVGQHVGGIRGAMQVGTVVGIREDRVETVGGVQLGRVRDKHLGTEKVQRRVQVVVDEIHEIRRIAAGVDAIDRAVERSCRLIVGVFPCILKVWQDVRNGRNVGRIVNKDNKVFTRIDKRAERRPRRLGECCGARRVGFGRQTGGLEGSGKRRNRLVVRVDNEQSDHVVGIGIDP